ncbi:MAG: DUF1289 domain-containing protein [Porticoccaceae bacterium]
MVARVKTPCVGICSSGIGDAVCRGCKRFAHEVIAWNTYSAEERRIVLDRLDGFLAQIVRTRVALTDLRKLRRAMVAQKLVVDEDRDPYCQIQSLLRAMASRIQQPAACGFRLLPAFADQSLAAVRDDIEREFWLLSQAHYDRYVAPGIVDSTVCKPDNKP